MQLTQGGEIPPQKIFEPISLLECSFRPFFLFFSFSLTPFFSIFHSFPQQLFSSKLMFIKLFKNIYFWQQNFQFISSFQFLATKLPIFGNKTSNFWQQKFQFISSLQFLATKLPIYFQLLIFGNKTSHLFLTSIFGKKTSNS